MIKILDNLDLFRVKKANFSPNYSAKIFLKIITWCTWRLTAVVNEEMLDLHAHEDVVLESRDVAVPDVEVPDHVLLLLDGVRVDLGSNVTIWSLFSPKKVIRKLLHTDYNNTIKWQENYKS
jgi:hypothetical protein